MMQSGALSFRIAPDKKWFLVLAALAVLPFLLSAGYSLMQLSQSRQDDAAAQLIIKANDTAQVVKERLTASVAALNAIASSDAALQDDLPALYRQAQRVMQHLPQSNAISLISPKGGVLFVTRQPLDSPQFTSHIPEVWKRVFDTAQAAVSEPFTSPIDRHQVASIGVPVFQRGKVAYCLNMIFLANSINDLLIAQQLPDQWSAEIISEGGKLLAHSRATEVNIGKPASDEIVAAKRAQNKSLFSTHAKDGTPAQAILVQVGNFGWSVAMTVPTSRLNEPIQNVTLLLLVFGGAFAILGGLAVVLPIFALRDMPAITNPRAHLGPSLIALAGSIVLGGYTAWLTQHNLQHITASVDAHRLIYAEQRQIGDLVHLLEGLETGQREFAATGNPIFLNYVDTASQKIPALTERIKAGFSKVDPQEIYWENFDSLSQQYLQFAAKVLAMRHTPSLSDVQRAALVESGRLIMDTLQLQVTEMNSRLEQRMNQAEISIASQQEHASQQQWLSSFAISALFLISAAIWLYERQRRMQVHAQLEISSSLLEQRVTQRTHDLVAANRRIHLYAQQAQALVDAERKRLSREVHDQVGQIFTGIKMIAGSLKNGQLDAAQQTALFDAVDSGVRISRRIAAELRPPLLDDFGLRAALEHFVKSCSEPVGLSHEVQFPEEHRLDALQMSELFRIVQEACVNVVRHAKAMHLEVVGLTTGDSLDVCIDDDGVGFDQAQVREDALGILGMQERAHLIDAQLHIGRSPMGGTRVHIRLTLTQHVEKERA